MSSRHRKQDATGVMMHDGLFPVWVTLPQAPTNGQPGFQVGCFWQNTAGSVGSLIYVNTGTTTSATWTNII